jgi:hypothetical protein
MTRIALSGLQYPSSLTMLPVGSVRRRRSVAVLAAAAAVGVDLLETLLHGTDLHHVRSVGAVGLMALLAAAVLTVAPRVESAAVALGAGVAAGGAGATVLSAILWRDGIPDPIVLRGGAGGVAFNLADVFLLAGDALLLGSAVLYGLRHRDRLLDSL